MPPGRASIVRFCAVDQTHCLMAKVTLHPSFPPPFCLSVFNIEGTVCLSLLCQRMMVTSSFSGRVAPRALLQLWASNVADVGLNSGGRGGGVTLNSVPPCVFRWPHPVSASDVHSVKLPAAFWKPKHVPAALSLYWSRPSPGKSSLRMLSPSQVVLRKLRKAFRRGLLRCSETAPATPGTLFLSTLLCFTSQDISLPKCDHADPVNSLSLSSSAS